MKMQTRKFKKSNIRKSKLKKNRKFKKSNIRKSKLKKNRINKMATRKKCRKNRFKKTRINKMKRRKTLKKSRIKRGGTVEFLVNDPVMINDTKEYAKITKLNDDDDTITVEKFGIETEHSTSLRVSKDKITKLSPDDLTNMISEFIMNTTDVRSRRYLLEFWKKTLDKLPEQTTNDEYKKQLQAWVDTTNTYMEQAVERAEEKASLEEGEDNYKTLLVKRVQEAEEKEARANEALSAAIASKDSTAAMKARREVSNAAKKRVRAKQALWMMYAQWQQEYTPTFRDRGRGQGIAFINFDDYL